MDCKDMPTDEYGVKRYLTEQGHCSVCGSRSTLKLDAIKNMARLVKLYYGVDFIKEVGVGPADKDDPSVGRQLESGVGEDHTGSRGGSESPLGSQEERGSSKRAGVLDAGSDKYGEGGASTSGDTGGEV